MQAIFSRLLRRNAPPQPIPLDTDAIALSIATRQSLCKRGLLLAYASEMGFIDDMVALTQSDIEAVDIPTRLLELNEVSTAALIQEPVVLFLASTTGSGDAPFAADRFCNDIMTAPAALSPLYFGLLCAGDSDYDEYCGFGHTLRDWLLASGARPLFTPVEIDDEEETAIRRWRHQLRQSFAAESVHA